MTREQALSQVAPNLSYFNDCKVPFAISECKSWINKIFDDFEAQMKTLDDKYAEAVNLYESAVMEFYKQMKAKDEEIERLKEKALDYATNLSFVTMDSKYKNSELFEQGMLKGSV